MRTAQNNTLQSPSLAVGVIYTDSIRNRTYNRNTRTIDNIKLYYAQQTVQSNTLRGLGLAVGIVEEDETNGNDTVAHEVQRGELCRVNYVGDSTEMNEWLPRLNSKAC
jgi:hypothetical protein